MKVLGVIPARLGSQRLPRKNLIDLGGKPLIHWTIEAAVESAAFDDLVVSTDSDDIAQAVDHLPVRVVKRPTNLAENVTPMLPVVQHAAAKSTADVVVLLQPTSPFRTAEDIALALELLERTGGDAVISVGAPEPDFCFERGHALRLRPARNIVVANGALYLITKDHLKVGDWYNGLTYAYEMPADRSIDIDTEMDLTIARAMVANGPFNKRD
jgi:CMP-N,N'-diacetyllegionaminic acid synthase